jgi:hypothetical protein
VPRARATGATQPFRRASRARKCSPG